MKFIFETIQIFKIDDIFPLYIHSINSNFSIHQILRLSYQCNCIVGCKSNPKLTSVTRGNTLYNCVSIRIMIFSRVTSATIHINQRSNDTDNPYYRQNLTKYPFAAKHATNYKIIFGVQLKARYQNNNIFI